jgi:hypothetical protein
MCLGFMLNYAISMPVMPIGDMAQGIMISLRNGLPNPQQKEPAGKLLKSKAMNLGESGCVLTIRHAYLPDGGCRFVQANSRQKIAPCRNSGLSVCNVKIYKGVQTLCFEIYNDLFWKCKLNAQSCNLHLKICCNPL